MFLKNIGEHVERVFIFGGAPFKNDCTSTAATRPFATAPFIQILAAPPPHRFIRPVTAVPLSPGLKFFDRDQIFDHDFFYF